MVNPGYADALRSMSKIVNSLMSRADCGPFREPVDWRSMELYDYPKIIKKMMDLGTVKRKLERNQYKTAKECAEDIRLIWTNCKTYNADGSDFYLLAQGFSKRFEERYKKVQAEFDTGDGERKPAAESHEDQMALDVKTNFANKLFRLSGMELGHVIQVLDLRCPQALEHPGPAVDNQTDKLLVSSVEINVELIDSRTFQELSKYVEKKTLSRPSGTSDTTGNNNGSMKKKQRRS